MGSDDRGGLVDHLDHCRGCCAPQLVGADRNSRHLLHRRQLRPAALPVLALQADHPVGRFGLRMSPQSRGERALHHRGGPWRFDEYSIADARAGTKPRAALLRRGLFWRRPWIIFCIATVLCSPKTYRWRTLRPLWARRSTCIPPPRSRGISSFSTRRWPAWTTWSVTP